MKPGTKTLLFGYHQFLIHPFFLLFAWWKIYGFRVVKYGRVDVHLLHPLLWVAAFVHDIGYWGADGIDGEDDNHPLAGADMVSSLSEIVGYPPLVSHDWFLLVASHSRSWHDNHSKSLNLGLPISPMCFADKWILAFFPPILTYVMSIPDVSSFRMFSNRDVGLTNWNWHIRGIVRLRRWWKREFREKGGVGDQRL